MKEKCNIMLFYLKKLTVRKNCWLVQDCELHSIATRFGSIAAQDRNSPDEKTGFAFLNCRVTGTGPLYVGRAMGQYSRIVYSYTYFDNVVAHGGWDDWDHASNKNKYLTPLIKPFL
jgi:hypothetical protein